MNSAGLAVFALLIAACAPQGVAKVIQPRGAPPRTCEMQVAVWCVLKDNISIEVTKSADSGFRYVWTMSGAYWSKHPAVILEPAGCRLGSSDVLELIRFEGDADWNGKKWDRMTVRLKSDKSCDLELLSPKKYADSIGAAFSANLSLIRACQAQPCEGPTVGERISAVPTRE